jgi:hypothetical protein
MPVTDLFASLSGGLAAGGGDAAPSSAFSTSNPIDAKVNGITVAPIAVNFGELINALIPGPPSTGGVGGNSPSPGFPTFGGDSASSVLSSLRTPNLNFDVDTNSDTQSSFTKFLWMGGLLFGSIVAYRKFK